MPDLPLVVSGRIVASLPPPSYPKKPSGMKTTEVLYMRQGVQEGFFELIRRRCERAQRSASGVQLL